MGIKSLFIFSLRYACFGTYMSNLYERRQVWAQAFRKHLLIRGNNTNNYAEAAMRVLKDSILQRSRAFNVPQLVDFVLYRLEGYYQRKLLAVANSRPLKWVKPQHRSTIQEDAITKVRRLVLTYFTCKFIVYRFLLLDHLRS